MKVLVVEKGISSMNERHWIGAVGTAAAQEAGVEVDKNKLVAELCRYASHRCDEKLIRLWVNHSGEAIDWYAEQVKKYNPDVKLHMEWDVGEGGHDTYYVPALMHNFQDKLPLNTPPYYGCCQGGSLLCTLDGLRINTKMEVLDKEGSVIEGLYAAGDCSGGFFAHNYPEYMVGVAVGRTLTEGYLLGTHFAEI